MKQSDEIPARQATQAKLSPTARQAHLSSEITGKIPLPETTRNAAAGLFLRFIVLAVGLTALLGLGLIVFDVADTLSNTREHLHEIADILSGVATGMQKAHPERPPQEIVSEVSNLTGAPMALVMQDGSILFSTDPEIGKHITALFGSNPAVGVRIEIDQSLGHLSGAWLIHPFGEGLKLLTVVGHSPEDEGLLQYMTISAGVLGLGLAISFWVMLGATRWILHRPLQRLIEQLTGALALDVERRRKAERLAVAARLEAERHLAFRNNLINASSSVGIVATDLEGRIQIYNNAAEQILGYSAEEIVGNLKADELSELTGRPASHEVPLLSLMRPLQGEEFIVDKAGEQRLLAMSRSVISDADGSRMGELLSFVDVTEPRRLEAELHLNEVQLVQSAKMASLGEMATGVAHELNQPLNNIGLLASRVQKRIGGLPPDDATFCRARLEKVQGQVERASRIIDQLRSFGRRSERRLQSVEIARPIQHVREMLGAQFEALGVALSVEIPADLPAVRADASQLEQVLVNLLLNAGDAHDSADSPAPSGPSERDSPGPSGPSERETKTAKEGRFVRISAEATQLDGKAALAVYIRDNGPGMSDEVRNRVFQPFFTTKEPGKGTGLGLSISYGLVRGFGGTLSVESREGHGAEFSLVLPLASDDDDGSNDAAHQNTAG